MLILRHASAGERVSPDSLDRLRRLDDAGREDADGLVGALAGYPLSRIVSSPHARCLQTVAPLVRARELTVEIREELRPDASLAELEQLLDELPETTLLCTHREVIERLFGGELTCEKGGTWLVAGRAGRLAPAAYLPPPSSVVKRAERAPVV